MIFRALVFVKRICVMHSIINPSCIHRISSMIGCRSIDQTELFILAENMGSNQAPLSKKRFYQVKIKSPEVASLQELGQLMDRLQCQAFRKTYGKIWDLAMIEVSMKAIASLTQYYDQPLRCFTFGDFQLVPTVEEFEEILGCPLGGRKPYLFSGFYPSVARIAKVVKITAQELDRVKQNRNGIVGIPRKHLEEKAKALAYQGEWALFIDVLVLLVFRVILFPNVDGLVDLAAIDAFLAYQHSKESLVAAILADVYDTFNQRCEKSGARIVCCTPTLYVWLVSHFFLHESRPTCPLQGHNICTEKGKANWEQLLASVVGASINWFPRWKEGKVGVLSSCEGFPNIPLMGTRGCINYNLTKGARRRKASRLSSHEISVTPTRRYFKDFARHEVQCKGKIKSLGEASMGSSVAIISGRQVGGLPKVQKEFVRTIGQDGRKHVGHH